MSAPIVDSSKLAGKAVCLVTSGHVGSNPRLVKEADALVLAGARVQVVAVDVTRLAQVQARDEFILGRRLWPCVRVQRGGLIGRALGAAKQRAARVLFSLGIRTDHVTQAAYDPMIGRLGRAAAAIPADLYIAHNLAALPAAHRAARRHQALLGFDAEDFHSGQFPDTPAHARSLALTRHIERRYLPCCDYMTAASPGIGAAYARACRLTTPVTVLNVFPRSEAPCQHSATGSAPAPSLYWFSQTIGPGRGLEAALEAIASSRSRPALYLQGTLAAGYGARLREIAGRLGIADRLVVLPPVLPHELPRVASFYDAGLATEPADTPNRDACLSNKLFTYLLAGIPVLATDTTGQGALARELPGAMTILPMNDSRQWPEAIDALLLDADRLAAARRAAWEAGQVRFNWDQEQAVFLDVVSGTLAKR